MNDVRRAYLTSKQFAGLSCPEALHISRRINRIAREMERRNAAASTGARSHHQLFRIKPDGRGRAGERAGVIRKSTGRRTRNRARKI